MEYGLIGEHLPHSFSKEIHKLCASYEYELCELAPSEVGIFMERADFSAINVTIPYKKTVMPYLDFIHPHAKEIGAANTIVKKDGKLHGYNTDFYGLAALILKLGISLEGKKVLILGTGGTAKTARAVAISERAASVLTVSRSKKNDEDIISYEEAYSNHGDAEIIINTTPCGMFPNENGGAGIAATPIELSRFNSLVGVVDTVYNPLRTNLVLDAAERGIAAVGGLYMLVYQGVLASRVFLGEDIEKAGADPETEKTVERVYLKTLRQKENAVLIGMPSCGKSTVGKVLAKNLQRTFLDTDSLVVESAGAPISDIFAKLGECEFRKMESDAVRMAARKTGAVIATGGGAVLNPENIRALRRNGRIYFLDRDPSKLCPTKDRPLFSDTDKIKKLYAERYEIYIKTADRVIKTDEVVEHTVDLITEDF